MQQSPFFTQQPQTSVEKLNIEQEKTGLGNSVILARSEVPESHRRQADAYMILKTHYGLPVVNASTIYMMSILRCSVSAVRESL